MKKAAHRTWVEIDLKAISQNVAALKGALSTGVSLMAVVKSNAYGHGMVLSAYAALVGGADWLAVDELYEALELRAQGVKAPVLVLGFTLPELYKDAAKAGVSVTISSLESLQALAKTKAGAFGRGKKLAVHIKFDTGLHRQGIGDTQVQQAVRILSSEGFKAIADLEGAYTHFAAMEDPRQGRFSAMQAEKFKAALSLLHDKGFDPISHASASAGVTYSKCFHFDMVRPGISVYGLWPSDEIRALAQKSAGPRVSLVPALVWKTIITEVKLVSKGEGVGYDLTHTLARDSRIAVIPVGYWQGLPRAASDKGQVLVGGKRAKIIGRVSMDMSVIDVTDISSVRQGDEVVIIGTQGKETITAEEAAEKIGTINYELVTRINPLIPRIYGK